VVGRKVIRTGLVLVLALAAAGIFAMVGRADDPIFGEKTASIGPGIVDAEDTVLVKASWQYLDSPTLNHSSVRFTHPAGWTLVSSDPSVCSQASTTTVTCPHGQIRTGDVVAQAVRLRTNSVLGDDQTVQTDLLFSERPDNPGRMDTEPGIAVQTDVISANEAVEPNRVGKCVGPDGGTVATLAGAGNSEASATVPETDELCTPFSIAERLRLNATETCIPDYACVLDVVTTDSALFPATDPIKLKIIFRGQNINSLPLLFVSDTRRIQVPDCPNDNVAAPDPCVADKRTRQQSVTWTVNWTGADPGWTG
jgi:hypothetical protein